MAKRSQQTPPEEHDPAPSEPRWEPLTDPVKTSNGLTEQTFAMPVPGGTLVRYTRTLFNRSTMQVTLADSCMAFVPEG